MADAAGSASSATLDGSYDAGKDAGGAMAETSTSAAAAAAATTGNSVGDGVAAPGGSADDATTGTSVGDGVAAPGGSADDAATGASVGDGVAAPGGSADDAPRVRAPADEPLAAGREVELDGTPMHGAVAVLEEYLEQKGRWKIRFADGVKKNVKPENLRLLANRGLGEAAIRTGPCMMRPISEMLEVLRSQPSEPLKDAGAGISASTDAAATPANAFANIELITPKQAPVPEFNLTLAGQRFSSFGELVKHIEELEARHSAASGCAHVKDAVSAAEMFLLFHLLTYCPAHMVALRARVRGIQFSGAGFVLVRLRWRRCVATALPALDGRGYARAHAVVWPDERSRLAKLLQYQLLQRWLLVGGLARGQREAVPG
eukprot:NODE_5269_length_1789_cov_9.311071.p1 GENE.NODE_5269_length_1789_cov_9.311071~~NODE_5269_length_1789_cov_9.311071.p1  ORF type:complete len:423 (+),score=73.27 NODE_5269_length_1789_cov_9.311071:145-1269(+)